MEYKDLIDNNKRKDNKLLIKENELLRRDNKISELENLIGAMQKQEENDKELQKIREQLIHYKSQQETI